MKFHPLSLAIAHVLAISAAHAAQIVDSTVDGLTLGGDCTVREAIANAQGTVTYPECGTPFDSTISFSLSGTDVISLTLGSLTVTGDISIEGPGGPPDYLTINAGGTSRVVEILASGTLSLQHLHLTGGSGSAGGGLYNLGVLNLHQVSITANTAPLGGGIWNDRSLNMTDTTVDSNSANTGGGMFNAGYLYAYGSTFSGNSAGASGGGLYTNSGSVALINSSVFSGNMAAFRGGGIRGRALEIRNTTLQGNSAAVGGALFASGPFYMQSSTINQNTASAYGGGFYNDSSTVSLIQSSTLANNVASDPGAQGGGIFNRTGLVVRGSTLRGNIAAYGGGLVDRSYLSMADSTIDQNTAAYSGGGLYRYSGTAGMVSSSTFSDNRALAGSGGGVWSGRGLSQLFANTLSGNSAFVSGGAVYASSGTVGLTASTIAYNQSGSGGGVDVINLNLNRSIVSGNTPMDLAQPLSKASADNYLGGSPLLTTLGDNGGPTQTHVPRDGSPVVDQISGCDATDQRGESRPVDLPGQGSDGSNTCDHGAVERQSMDVPVDLTDFEIE